MNREVVVLFKNREVKISLLASIKIGVIVVCILSQFGCSTSSKIKIESSFPTRPSWIDRPPISEDFLYFVGISSASESFEEGRKIAFNEAISEISGYIGTKIESEIKSNITETESNHSVKISSESKALVKGVKVVDSYYEKIVRVDKNYRMERYDVYLLVAFSSKEYEKELERQKNEKERIVKTAFQYYLSGLTNEESGDFYNAIVFYKKAINLIDKVGGVVGIDRSGVGDSEELRIKLESRINHTKLRLSKVLISVKVNGSTQFENVFVSNLSSSLGRNSFLITHEDPVFKIEGSVMVSESSYQMNSYVYYAEGSVSVKRVSDHHVVATYAFKTKGFHKNKKHAALNALADAGMEVGDALSEILSKNIGISQLH